MLVTPSPVCLLIAGLEPGKLNSFAMVFCVVSTIGLIFATIPFVIVIVSFVVIGADGSCSRLAILGSHCRWHHCQWEDEGGAQQGRVAETWHHYFHAVSGASTGPPATKAMNTLEANRQSPA